MASSAKDIQLRELKDTLSQLKTMISEQTELIRSLRLMLDEKSSHEKALQEQVDYLTKKLFGSSSEKRSDDIPGQQNLFDEAEMEQAPSLPEEETVIREHTRKKKATHEDLFKGLKVEKVVIPLPEENQICPICGTQMVLIGEEYVRRELEFIPATCKVIEYYSQSYGCPSCKEGFGDTEKPVIVKSQVPAALVGKGPASASAVAWTMYQKYANGLPTTLANWIIYCSQNYFQPMYEYFHCELLKRSFTMADETRVQVLNEEGRRAQTQSFMWLFRSGEDGPGSGIERGRAPSPDPIIHVAVPKRRGRASGDHPVWLFPDQERQPCKGVPGRLQRILGNGWISGIQQSSRDQTLLLLGAYPSILYRCRSQRKTV